MDPNFPFGGRGDGLDLRGALSGGRGRGLRGMGDGRGIPRPGFRFPSPSGPNFQPFQPRMVAFGPGGHVDQIPPSIPMKDSTVGACNRPPASKCENPVNKTNYAACLVLGGVGDALGYKCGEWEFCHSGTTIHGAVMTLGGLEGITVQLPDFMVSDDTVMALATAEGLTECDSPDKELLYKKVAEKYIICANDMTGRAPGDTTMTAIRQLRPNLANGYRIPFNERGGGCGAAMRAVPIGMRYPREDQLDDLIRVAVETGRMTHHNPTGYLGAVVAALFTSYAYQKCPVVAWGKSLMDTLDRVWSYVDSTGIHVEENLAAWGYFQEQWAKYLEHRGLSNGSGPVTFPDNYNVEKRDEFYRSVSFSGWGGASGHDAPMIAYDALLGSGDRWDELCFRGVFHGGDNDSTGILACSWFGMLYGFQGVPANNYKDLEYKERLTQQAERLYDLAHPAPA